MAIDRTFNLTDIVRILDVKRHFVIHLVETGIIKPLQDVRGRGKSREYSFKNLIEIGIFFHLSRMGLAYETIRMILEKFNKFIESCRQPIDALYYISILGYVEPANRISITDYWRLDEETQKISPEEFLAQSIQREAEEFGSKREDFSFYLILDVSNIRRNIELLSRI